MSNPSVLLTLSGFFPRNWRDSTNIDNGFCDRRPCEKCGHFEFSWNSLEFCPYCENIVDYWCHESAETNTSLKGYGAARLEKEYLEAVLTMILGKYGLPQESYTLELNFKEGISLEGINQAMHSLLYSYREY